MSDRHVLSKNQDYQAHLLTTLPTENSEIKMATPAKPTPTLPALKPDSDTESEPSYDKLKPDSDTEREPSYDKHGFFLVARDVANIAPGLRVSRAVRAVTDSKEREKKVSRICHPCFGAEVPAFHAVQWHRMFGRGSQHHHVSHCSH